jgi:hypothetical protein
VERALLFAVWLSFMALAGFFIPSFLSDLPLFQIKEIVVEGNRTVDLDTVRSALFTAEGSVLETREDEILRVLNERTGGRIKKVHLKREFSLEGISVRVRVEERVPVAKVLLGRTYMLMDEEGKTFPPYPGHAKGLIEVTAYDFKILENHFGKLYSMIKRSGLEVDRIKVLRDRTVVVVGRRVLILPPIDLLPDNLADRLGLIYNFQEGKIDLRFGRFILVRN